MFNKSFTSSFLIFIIVTYSLSFGQSDTIIVTEDFETFTAGAQVACQDTIHIFWDTWNSIPCDTVEDPYVTNTEAHSGVNSVWIQQNNDLVSSIPNYTDGKYSISFYMYIPSGYTASWGQLAAFYNPDSTEWGFYAKFDPFGNGNIVAGGWGAAQFTFSYDTWMHNELIIDLDADLAEYFFEGNLVHSWQWTLGSSGDTCSLQLSKTDILGSDYPNPDSSQWFLDDYALQDITVGVKDFSVPTKYILHQNYPNPFNPKTTIKYQIPELSFVTIKVYDLLGREVTTLVNQEMPNGSYEIEFSSEGGSSSGGVAYDLPSGIYFYRLQAGDIVKTKKMVLMK